MKPERWLLSVLVSAVVAVWVAAAPAVGADVVQARPPAPQFKAGPTATADGANFRIEFEVNRATDVAVEIQDADGKVVRHLVAGLLGPNAPEPLVKDSLKQSLVWDGKDDDGRSTALTAGKLDYRGPFKVRVGLGLLFQYDKVLGWHPLSGLSSINALAVNGEGEVYVFTRSGVLVLDANGRYLRQMLPAGGKVPPEKPTLLRPVRLADGAVVYTEPLGIGHRGGVALTRDGDILTVVGYNGQRKVVRVGKDGSLQTPPHRWLIHPKNDVGIIKIALSPDERWLYLVGQVWGHDDSAVGRLGGVQHIVTRLNLKADQVGEVFLGENENGGAGGSKVRTPKGIATDSRGRIYVADYGNNRIGVWDNEALLVREFKVPSPQEVYVHPKTGDIYVLSGPEKTIPRWEGNYFWQSATLYKFSAEGKELARLDLEPPFIQKKAGDQPRPKFILTGALDSSGERPRVYVGVCDPGRQGGSYLLVRVNDTGDRFDPPVDLLKDFPDSLQSVREVALDRKRDELYVRDGGLWKLWRFDGVGGKGEALTGWKDPRTGKSVRGSQMCVGPDGLVYVSAWHTTQTDTGVLRYDRTGNLVPFAAANNSEIVQRNLFEGSSGQRRKGIYPGPDRRLYLMYADLSRTELPSSAWDRTCLQTYAVDAYDLDGKLVAKRLIAHLRSGASGLRSDRWGNLYVGDNVKPLGYAYPAEAAAVLADPFKRSCVYMDDDGRIDRMLFDYGCVFKFPPTGGRMEGLDTKSGVKGPPPQGNLWSPVPEVQWFPWMNRQVKVTGALWQYLGIARMPAQTWAASAGQTCVCGASVFDLDEHARLYLPDTLTGRIKVLDRNGQLLTTFGQRGNMDDQGPEIRFASVPCVAASSRAAYVGDDGNARVVRVRLGYQAEETAALR